MLQPIALDPTTPRAQDPLQLHPSDSVHLQSPFQHRHIVASRFRLLSTGSSNCGCRHSGDLPHLGMGTTTYHCEASSRKKPRILLTDPSLLRSPVPSPSFVGSFPSAPFGFGRVVRGTRKRKLSSLRWARENSTTPNICPFKRAPQGCAISNHSWIPPRLPSAEPRRLVADGSLGQQA